LFFATKIILGTKPQVLPRGRARDTGRGHGHLRESVQAGVLSAARQSQTSQNELVQDEDKSNLKEKLVFKHKQTKTFIDNGLIVMHSFYLFKTLKVHYFPYS
jgi:hypothetical protein